MKSSVKAWLGKPWLHIRTGVHPAYVAHFLARYGARVVNIPGKRESSAPGISCLLHGLLTRSLRRQPD